MESNTHREIQENLLNKLFLILGFIAIPALSFSLFRYFDIGWQLSFNAQIFVGSIVVLVAIYRKSIDYYVKAGFLVAICFIFAIFASLDLGLSGFLVEYLMLAVFVGVIFLGRKQALFIYFGGATVIFVIGILIVKGVISPNTNIDTYTKYFSSWLSTLTSYLFVTALVILVVGEIGHLLSDKIADLQKMNKALKTANAEIKKLQGILPICASCKKIRDDKGYWQQVEVYIRDHSDAKFSHGICPDCIQKLYPEQKNKDAT
jgi:hypothetical protein